MDRRQPSLPQRHVCSLARRKEDGQKRKLLLSLPSIDESHTGETMAIGVAQIIRKIGLQDRIGDFVLDNATNCTTAVELLSKTFGFDTIKRRLRYTACIINLVAQQIMYGTDLRTNTTLGICRTISRSGVVKERLVSFAIVSIGFQTDMLTAAAYANFRRSKPISLR